jgi:hypothetical protein
MTDRLDEIEGRLNAATDGPWTARQDFIDGGVPDCSKTLNGGERGDYIGTIALRYDGAADAEFIAAAPTDMAALLGALRATLAECDATDTETDEALQGDLVNRIRTAINEALEG